MSTDNNAVPVVFPDCPNWGKGGSYVFDPVTKQRTLVQAAHTDDQNADQATDAASTDSETVAPPVKEKKRA